MSFPPDCAIIGLTPPPLPPNWEEPIFTKSTAFILLLSSLVTPTTKDILLLSVVITATTQSLWL